MGTSTLSPTEERDEWICDPFPSLGETPVLLPAGPARTVSMVMKAEKEDLKEAAKDTYNVIMDLNLDGHVRWVSPSWQNVIGTPCESIQGKPISTVLVEGAETFQSAIDTMKEKDQRSYWVRFAINMGSMSTLLRDPLESAIAAEEEGFRPEEMDEVNNVLEMEGQGILIKDRATGNASHTMWVIRPFVEVVEPKEVAVELPQYLVDSLGVGASMLAQYLNSLTRDALDPANRPNPPPVLCRICECEVQQWWFEKHSELCMLEHKAESEVQIAQENLLVQRSAIAKVLDQMERASTARGQAAELGGQGVSVEYRGFSIGPPSTPSSGTASPAPAGTRSRSSSISKSSRSKSFAVRRPQVRIVELLMDLCDTAIEIETPALKQNDNEESGTFRTQTPESEAKIAQVLQWHSPSTNTLDEQGLALLCSDTERNSRAKVDAVLRHSNTIEYAERIRFEFSMLVDGVVEDLMRKLIIAEEEQEDGSDEREDSDIDEITIALTKEEHIALAEQRKIMDAESAIESAGSSSPHGSSTPRSQHSTFRGSGRRRSRFSLQPPPDADGCDSDTSARSSLATTAPRTESPASDRESRSRMQPKDRKRHSLGVFQHGTSSPIRQPSPARPGSAASPLHMGKPPRLSAIFDGQIQTPITSPLLTTGELSSPAIESFHHRRQSSITSSENPRPPPSPRMSAVNSAQTKPASTSIKDFDIIKPISKGAFGSVYLAKKKNTGDYFAIKVLKKADMIAKNQVTNVRAERAIMMVQGESDLVAKLYWTFSNSQYLYLVMEYMNGGDCAALIKALGGLSEDWSKKYLAEVILGVENLHERGIIHRDLKPDNLLIDQNGHLKLTDFGLSRMGLLGRQKRALQSSSDSTPDLLKNGMFNRSRSVASSRSASFDFPPGTSSPANTPVLTPESSYQLSAPSYFSLNRENSISREPSLKERRSMSTNQRSDSGGSDGLATLFTSFSLNDPASFGVLAARRTPGVAIEEDAQSTSSASSDFSNNLQPASTQSSNSLSQQTTRESMLPPQLALFDPEDSNRKFVGTPDYLAPETINGTGQDEMSDWWSLGCILFEFLYGYPPFHADTHERVFDNILNRRIDWPDDGDVPVSAEAKDLMNRLMCTDQETRLGANGAEEIKQHPFFEGVDWDKLLEDEASFIPAPANVEDTEYFDARGATLQPFGDDLDDDAGSSQAVTPSSEYAERPHDAVPRSRKELSSSKRGLMPLHIPAHVREGGRSRRLSEPVVSDDFGSFQFKNLPVLEKANKDVIQRLRTEALQAAGAATSGSSTSSPTNSSEGSPISSKAGIGRTLSASSKSGSKRAVSPSNLHTSAVSSPVTRPSQPSSPLLVSFTARSDRKASNASTTSTASSSALMGPPMMDVPRLSTNFKLPTPSTASSSPVKTFSTSPVKTFAPPLKSQTLPTASSLPRKDSVSGHRRSGSMRVRSLTVGSQDGEPPAFLDSLKQHKRRSQVFDMSPSSSDNEESRSSALLRVQKRRQSSRRMSTFSTFDGPCYRPLDVMICEDHPVSRMVMERMLEKLGCRSISVENGSEAVRLAMSEVKFDIIFTEFRMPQINGEDFARMVKTTRGTNTQTPIVVLTGYVRDLKPPHSFDELIEKPATPDKLIEILDRLCQWRPADDPDRPQPEQIIADPSPTKPVISTADEGRRPSLERTVTAPIRPLSSLSPKSFLEAARNHGMEKPQRGGLQRTFSDDHSIQRSHPRRSLSFSPLGEGGLGLPPPSNFANYISAVPIPDSTTISPIKGLNSPPEFPTINSAPTSPRPPITSKSTDRFSRSGASFLTRAAVSAKDFLLPHSSHSKEDSAADSASGSEMPDIDGLCLNDQSSPPEAAGEAPRTSDETLTQSVTSKWGDKLKSSLSSKSSNQVLETGSLADAERSPKPSSMKKTSDPFSPKSPVKTGMFTKHARVQSPPRSEKLEASTSKMGLGITSPTSRFLPTNTVRKDFAPMPPSPSRSPTRQKRMDREAAARDAKSEPTTPTKKDKSDFSRAKSPSPEETPNKSRFFRTVSKDKTLQVPKTDSADDEGPSIPSPSKTSKTRIIREKRSRGFLSDIKRTKSDEFKS